MKNYIQSFVREIPKNEVGATLAFITLIALTVFGVLAVAATFMGGEVKLLPTFTLPIVFAMVTATHYLARPAVINHYAKA